MDRDEVALILGMDASRIRIIPSACGGGFGGKLDLSVQPLIALAAWKSDRPVRWTYTRPESMQATTKRHPARIEARFACDGAGKLTAVEFAGDFNTGAYASWGPTVANRVPVHASGPYLTPNYRATGYAIHTNGPIAGAFRGFGVPQATIMQETLYDELAGKLGIDRLEFRLKNADTAITPDAGKTSASRQTFVTGKAAEKAGRALREKILRFANVSEKATIALEGASISIQEGDAVRRIDLAALKAGADGL